MTENYLNDLRSDAKNDLYSNIFVSVSVADCDLLYATRVMGLLTTTTPVTSNHVRNDGEAATNK